MQTIYIEYTHQKNICKKIIFMRYIKPSTLNFLTEKNIQHIHMCVCICRNREKKTHIHKTEYSVHPKNMHAYVQTDTKMNWNMHAYSQTNIKMKRNKVRTMMTRANRCGVRYGWFLRIHTTVSSRPRYPSHGMLQWHTHPHIHTHIHAYDFTHYPFSTKNFNKIYLY